MAFATCHQRNCPLSYMSFTHLVFWSHLKTMWVHKKCHSIALRVPLARLLDSFWTYSFSQKLKWSNNSTKQSQAAASFSESHRFWNSDSFANLEVGDCLFPARSCCWQFFFPHLSSHNWCCYLNNPSIFTTLLPINLISPSLNLPASSPLLLLSSSPTATVAHRWLRRL